MGVNLRKIQIEPVILSNIAAMIDKFIQLKPTKEKSLQRFHPWIFSGAIKTHSNGLQEGDVVTVLNNKERILGKAHYSLGSIAARMLSFEFENINQDFWNSRITAAYNTRKNIGFIDKEGSDIFRLVHAEGDHLPGLIVDFYNGTAVVQCHSIGMHKSVTMICDALLNCTNGMVKSIYDKSAETLPKEYSATIENGYVHGEDVAKLEGSEYGNHFFVNWVTGQKTGFFIDQRENRRLIGEYAKGKKVLNTFCYSGGFSIFALTAGASQVDSLDSSQKAMDLVDENVAYYPEHAARHKSIKADAMEFIKNLDDDYDIIILDPPAFAKHRDARHKAVQGYKRLNARAIEQIKPGGIIFTFSCSQVVDKELFRHTIAAAAISAKRKIRILHQLHQPADHPINVFHPESEYLKGLAIQVD
ncbi:MAG: 23S rRNA (cytosine1962-C5)-methyltransferase [Parvicellaceae bacterium]|jgi:23S rRNA (cytosine1962-C5)-methyltransferase